MNPDPPRISGVFVYPVKSCRGIALDRVELTARGLAFDREWMVTDGAGQFLTQREEPRLALVDPRLDAESLQLNAPGLPPLRVPLEPSVSRPDQRVRVWSFTGRARGEGTEAAAWFSRFLGRPAALVRWHPDVRRLSSLEWTGGVEAPNAFSDGFPLLVLSEASLDDLNARRLPAQPLPLNRFRPNLVLSGVPAYAEDRHAWLRLRNVDLRLVKPCARCVITTTDQGTSVVEGTDPLRTLASYRRDPRVSGVVFGQNAIVIRGHGEFLHVGQEASLEAPPSS